MKTIGDVMRKLREDAYHHSMMLRAEIVTPRPAWETRANCANWTDPQPFDDGDRHNWRRAAAVCRTCPVRLDCLADAWAHERGVKEHTFGVRGGIPAHGRILAGAPQDIRGPIEHGTLRGYNQHRYRKIPQCAACRAAWNLYAQRTRPSRARTTEDAA